MAATPPSPPAPSPQDGAGESNWVSSIFSKINLSSKFFIMAAKEWLPSLLKQPTQPPFEYDASFDNEISRSARLIVIVIIISSLILGGVKLVSGRVDVTNTVRYAFGIIVIAILIALIYKPVAFVCGIRICPRNSDQQNSSANPKTLSPQQIAFTVLYIFVPWLPIFAFIRASFRANFSRPGDILSDFLLIAPLICLIYIIINFARAVKLITNCSWSRIWPSLILPLIILIVYDAL